MKISNDKFYFILIAVLSIAVPLIVSFLMFIPQPFKLESYDFSYLSHLNGILNFSTSFLLLAGLYSIKTLKRPSLHKGFMLFAFTLSILFLISYVIYHSQVQHTIYGGIGFIKYFYFSILIAHIFLSVFVIPLVLLSIYFALTDRISLHVKFVKYTFPIWLFVSISGVIVYLMIRPYYV
jgi:putative membrane protein